MEAPSPILINDMPQSLTYQESLSVAWLLWWRSLVFGGLIGFAVGFVLGFFGAAVGADKATVQLFVFAFTLFGGFFVIGPLIVVPMMVKKQYSSFRFGISR